MTELKCPVCNTVLDRAFLTDKVCGCPKCRNMGNVGLWELLIDTKKKLDEAIDLLKMLYGDYNLDWCVVDSDQVYDFLKQINQKD